MEDTEPHVQRLFHGSYRETGMWPQGLASVGFSVVQTPRLLGTLLTSLNKYGTANRETEEEALPSMVDVGHFWDIVLDRDRKYVGLK